MFFSKETIESLGYEFNKFIEDHIDKYSNCCVKYTDEGIYFDYDFDSQEGIPNIGEVMSEQRRKDAIKYIMACLEDGYIDLGLHDQDELMIVEEAMELLIAVEKFNSTPLVNPISSEDLKKVLERSNNELN